MDTLAASALDRTPPPILLPDGRSLPIRLRRSARARRMALRLDPAERAVEIVLPMGVPLARALAFLEAKRGWLVAQGGRLPRPIPFVDGAIIPLLGVPHALKGLGPGSGAGTAFRIAAGVIEVTGRTEHLARRTRAGLARHAQALLTAKTAGAAARIGRACPKVTLGDARTRWGSCAATGNIRYSWRLVLAPESVMDYVVAHEVAHLVEMNHRPRFWALVEGLHPDHAAPRAWLKRHGAELLAYG